MLLPDASPMGCVVSFPLVAKCNRKGLVFCGLASASTGAQWISVSCDPLSSASMGGLQSAGFRYGFRQDARFRRNQGRQRGIKMQRTSRLLPFEEYESSKVTGDYTCSLR